MTGNSHLLSLENVAINYDRATAVKRVSLVVSTGEIVALMGANGAGKTTTLRCISGLVRSAHGSIEFQGVNIGERSPVEIVRLGISHVQEGRRIFPRLTVQDNLELGGYDLSRSKSIQQMQSIFEMFPILSERAGQLGATLSGGEQQMLAIGRALMAEPRLLLLDEPSLGLAPIVVRALFDRLEQILSRGVTILLVEQNARLALNVSDRAYVLERGEVVCSGPSDEVARDERVVRAYLGGV